MIAWSDRQLVVLSIGCLILAGTALWRQRPGAGKIFRYGLIWAAIFLVVTAIFRAAG